jgi:hypothetical protein
MQSAKDSFYMALRTRLATVNPDRKLPDNSSRPAIIVAENETPCTAQQLNTFCIRWGATTPAQPFLGASRVLTALACEIDYASCGDDSALNAGRTLTALDTELMRICAPVQTPKLRYAADATTDLGTNVFWTSPRLESLVVDSSVLRRKAILTVFFFPEVTA